MKKMDFISKFDFAILLTLVTGISFCLSYLYKAGEFTYYNIPYYFIDIQSKDVFFIMLSLLPTIITLFFNLYFETDYAQKKKEKELKNILSNIDEKYILLKNSVTEIKEKLNKLQLENNDKTQNEIKIDFNILQQLESTDKKLNQMEKSLNILEKNVNKVEKKLKNQNNIFLTIILLIFCILLLGAVIFISFKYISNVFGYLMIFQLIVCVFFLF